MRTLLKQICLWPEMRRTDIMVEEGGVSFSLPTGAACGQVLDLEGRMALKGFADVHLHLDKALVASEVTNASGTLDEAIRIMRPYKAAMSREGIYDRAERALTMCRRHGSRFLRTHVDVDTEIGLRAVEALLALRQRYREAVLLQIVAFPQEGLEDRRNVALLDEALRLGVDAVGGLPARDARPADHMKTVFDLAEKHGVGVDMHVDETDDPASNCLEVLAGLTLERGMRGRVVAAHCCSLAAQSPERVDRVLDTVAAAEIAVVSLPSTNLYLQGRGDAMNVRRGIPPLKRMLAHGIRVALASDNMQDPFNPFGVGNPLQQALIAGHGCHMGGADDFVSLFDMITRHPLAILGVDCAWREGMPADFVVLDATSPREAIVEQKGVFADFRSGAMQG